MRVIIYFFIPKERAAGVLLFDANAERKRKKVKQTPDRVTKAKNQIAVGNVNPRGLENYNKNKCPLFFLGILVESI